MYYVVNETRHMKRLNHRQIIHIGSSMLASTRRVCMSVINRVRFVCVRNICIGGCASMYECVYAIACECVRVEYVALQSSAYGAYVNNKPLYTQKSIVRSRYDSNKT